MRQTGLGQNGLGFRVYRSKGQLVPPCLSLVIEE